MTYARDAGGPSRAVGMEVGSMLGEESRYVLEVELLSRWKGAERQEFRVTQERLVPGMGTGAQGTGLEGKGSLILHMWSF